MKRNTTLRAVSALGLLVVLLSACTPPSSLITPAQQTAVVATGIAAANSALTVVPASQTPALPTQAAGGAATVSPSVPVTGATTPSITATSSAGTANGVNGSNGASGNIPNTGATATTSGTTQGTTSATGCSGLLNVGASGQLATLLIKNDSNGPVNFTMGLSSPNSFGQCGYLTWGPIKAGQSLKVRVPVTQIIVGDSCYWAWAAITNQSRQSIVRGDSAGYCITSATRWVINIHSDRIRLAG